MFIQVFGGRHSNTCALQSGTQGNPLPKRPANGCLQLNLERRRLGHTRRPRENRLDPRTFCSLLQGLPNRRLRLPRHGGSLRQRPALLQQRGEALLVGRAHRVGAEHAPEPPAVVGEGEPHGVRLLQRRD